MRTKLEIDGGPISAPGSNVIQDFLAELSPPQLDRVAIAIIREHRVRLQHAQELFEQLDRLQTSGSQEGAMEGLRHDYSMAMLNLHAQHELVSRVIEKLGYIPCIDGLRPALN